jgi:hypothetical protein
MCHSRAVRFEIDPVAHFPVLIPSLLPSNFPPPFPHLMKTNAYVIFTRTQTYVCIYWVPVFFKAASTIRLLRWWCWHNSFAATLSAEVRPLDNNTHRNAYKSLVISRLSASTADNIPTVESSKIDRRKTTTILAGSFFFHLGTVSSFHFRPLHPVSGSVHISTPSAAFSDWLDAL